MSSIPEILKDARAHMEKALDSAKRLLEIARRQEGDARTRYLAGAVPKVGSMSW